MTSESKGKRFMWERLVISARGPPSPITRLVLLVLAIYFSKGAGTAWPSIKTISADSRLSERAVAAALAFAVREGWITKRSFKDPNNKQGWRRNVYSMAFPESIAYAPDAGRTMDGHASGAAPPDVNRHASGESRHAPDDNFVMHQVPTNNVLNSFNSTTRAGANAQGVVAENGDQTNPTSLKKLNGKTEQEKPGPSNPTAGAEIAKNRSALQRRIVVLGESFTARNA